jgi:4-hydroxy-3-methylbut-2-enyl diphosphate reductase
MSSLTITVARNAGFCFGVKRAIDLAREAVAEHHKVAMLGDIVHNESVVADLEKAGVIVFSDIDQVPSGMPVLFRSHGTPLPIWQKAAEKGLVIIDATCPLVKEIHKASKMLAEDNRKIIIIGDKGHEEVEGIASQTHDPIILSNAADALQLRALKRAGIVIQSTQFMDNVNEIVNILVTKVQDLRIINTICQPTRNRQKQLKELAVQNDVMIIVGSFTSANTKRLTSIAKQINPRSYQVQGPEDVDLGWFKAATTVGVSAGASTPAETVVAVVKKINQFRR